MSVVRMATIKLWGNYGEIMTASGKIMVTE